MRWEHASTGEAVQAETGRDWAQKRLVPSLAPGKFATRVITHQVNPSLHISYDLRRLRLKGFISRKPGTTRYELTPDGRHTSLFLARLYQRVLRPAMAAAAEPPWKADIPIRCAKSSIDSTKPSNRCSNKHTCSTNPLLLHPCSPKRDSSAQISGQGSRLVC